MTCAMSNLSDEDTERYNENRQVDLTIGTLKSMKMWAHEQYNVAMRDGGINRAMYWDGYIRALQHIVEQEGQ